MICRIADVILATLQQDGWSFWLYKTETHNNSDSGPELSLLKPSSWLHRPNLSPTTASFVSLWLYELQPITCCCIFSTLWTKGNTSSPFLCFLRSWSIDFKHICASLLQRQQPYLCKGPSLQHWNTSVTATHKIEHQMQNIKHFKTPERSELKDSREKTWLWSAPAWKLVKSALCSVLAVCSPSAGPRGAFKGGTKSFPTRRLIRPTAGDQQQQRSVFCYGRRNQVEIRRRSSSHSCFLFIFQ